jgi:hypothetical protein
MAEILVKFDEPIAAVGGKTYFGQAVGREVEGGLWQGWLEFQSVGEESDPLASGMETTQPNRTNLEYWAQGLTRVYLEGALARAILLAEPPGERAPIDSNRSRFEEPRRRRESPSASGTPVPPHAILNPFQVYAQGEEILRRELNALSRDHIKSIVAAYRFDASNPDDVNSSSRSDLIEAIVGGVRSKEVRAAPLSRDSQKGL